MFSGVPNSHLYAAYRVTSKFSLRDGTEITSSGTGFFIQNQNGEICLLSNRHMFDAGYGMPLGGKYLGAQLLSVLIDGFRSDGSIDAVPTTRVSMYVALDRNAPVYASNYEEDVACFRNPQVFTIDGSEPRVDFFLPASNLATDSWIHNNLSVCDFVAFPGYPPWYDRFGQRPILRTGTISSDPRTNYSDTQYERGRRVAYEAFSFGGSSGSPVFATQKGFRGGPGITVTGFREGMLVGINAGHYTDNVGSHAGVSYFFKSSVILELVNVDG